MARKMFLHVEIMGCPTTCQHCWVVGRNYQTMPIDEFSWILENVRQFCSNHDITLNGGAMHEIMAHPQAAQVIRLLYEIWNESFSALPTTGVPLVVRNDCHEIFEAMRSTGSHTLWFAFHGANEVHDRAVMHKGAYEKSLHAIELARSAGMDTGCNLFVTKENVQQFDQIIADLQNVGIQEIDTEVYSFTPNSRGRHTEALRPEWQDVQVIAGQLEQIPETQSWRHFWQRLPHTYTESWFVQQALEGTWPDEEEQRSLYLVCRPNLDIYRGISGQYNKCYGNLRVDGIAKVLEHALKDGEHSFDEIWFTNDQLLSVQELAARYGNAQSQRIHTSHRSIRHWWSDLARRSV